MVGIGGEAPGDELRVASMSAGGDEPAEGDDIIATPVELVGELGSLVGQDQVEVVRL